MRLVVINRTTLGAGAAQRTDPTEHGWRGAVFIEWTGWLSSGEPQ
jgi:hypothetical protein